ncbi:MgtC/SapB family protein [Lentilactobacillus parafarraginis]|uniref:Mg2+ transporter-C family protein n=3 Tax=Lentilactobacillus parafarraginis TaxID=390842 RepID=A0A0R1YQ22_9LACO|nr:MgtC/SapB family protein [Lentilactobacillus parafarraginis]EHM01242.1 Mg2+ transporter-C family protein [Lentilactobacillus parafarraginis F0439]KRM44321.1 Mg2+ transporter-C family protein [Lentilactobacillus parafarraginis DSM 18390 = JCM 14109]TLQ18498.1 MgtC/SapB family protein [Lentilactobacillus parafarraginis]
MSFTLYQLEWILRLVVAAICGGMVGFERKVRLKTAGIRTHMLVAVGSALFMLISKYGFFDVAGHSSIGLDPSRIAAGVVTGIGFIGAGAIMTRNNQIDGLTTAAGLWATAAIGLAIGADMYVIGIAGTGCILITQVIVRRIRALKRYPNRSLLRMEVTLSGQLTAMDQLPSRLKEIGGLNSQMRILKYDPESFTLAITVRLKKKVNPNGFIKQMTRFTDVQEIEVID